MVKLLTPADTMFESVTCSRCGGTGQYSFNQVDGSRCYGCGGQGVKLTKRGQAAAAFHKELLTKKVSDLQIGDMVHYRTMVSPNQFASGYAPIVELDLEPKQRGYSIINGVRKDVYSVSYTALSPRWGKVGAGVGPDSMVVIKGTDQERAEAKAKALDYQASLTQAGKPRKVK